MSATIVKINDKPNSADFVEYIMDSISDITTLPTDCADGSIAYTANLQSVYLLKNGVWEHKGGGGGDISVEPLNVSENGEYPAPSGKAYSPVNVNVPTPPPALQSKTVTQNGTVTPDQGYDGLSSVLVNVSGGGGDTAFVGTGEPPANLGSDGDYYYQRSQYEYGYTTDTNSDSNTRQSGYEFTVNDSISVVGLRAYVRGTTNANLYLAESNGNTIKQLVNLTFTKGWNYALFDAPVTLTAGYNYIVQCETVKSNMLRYQSKNGAIFNSKITGVRGRYGGLPGTQDNNAIYGTDILIAGDGLYHVIKEYHKASGAWEVIT